MSGTLHLVPTPIGNLADITLRALETLKGVEIVAAEDTRRTRILLDHFGIFPPHLVSYYEHNAARRGPWLIERMLGGADVALVSDAGTPGVSDPGFRLVTRAIEEGIRVVPLPGATAVTTALCAGGLPTDRFHFFGYLPPRRGKRRGALLEIRDLRGTLVFYESPRRLRALLADVREVLGNRRVVVAREMTKIHEAFLRGRVDEVTDRLPAQIQGEITLLVEGRTGPPSPPAEDELAVEIARMMAEGNASPRDISLQLSERYGLPRRTLYQIALGLQKHRTVAHDDQEE